MNCIICTSEKGEVRLPFVPSVWMSNDSKPVPIQSSKAKLHFAWLYGKTGNMTTLHSPKQ